MRAAICTRYGPPEVVEVRDVETPTPAENGLRVRVHASTVSAGDYRLRGANVPTGFGLMVRLGIGLRGPRRPILGQVFSGVVESAGGGSFQPGVEVFGTTDSGGGHAEYAVLPANAAIARKPANLSHAEAAAIPFGGLTALHFLRAAGIEDGRRVLVYGASGDVGTAMVQLAKHFGAHVTGVCSTKNIERIRSLGADVVVDYTKDEIPPPGERYDIIAETVGATQYPRWKPALADGGRFLMIAGGLPDYLGMIPVNLFGAHTIVAGIASVDADGMDFLRRRAEDGSLRPVIDRTYPLDDIVEAHRYAESGRKVGTVVVKLAG